MEKPEFAVEIAPHRSLTPRGMVILLGSLAVLNFAAGTFMWWLGAWPVVGFMGLDVALIWFALKWSMRRAGRRERITVTEEELTIDRFVGDRRTENLSFARPFFQIVLERDEARDIVGRLAVRSKGRSHQIGSFLGAEERLELARALEQALLRPRTRTA